MELNQMLKINVGCGKNSQTVELYSAIVQQLFAAE